MFIDEARITVKGGQGGYGKVAFFRNRKGPSGGNGGKGGDVYAVATSNLTHLKNYVEVFEYMAENGEPGGDNHKTGAGGKDLLLKMPIGTTIIDTSIKKEIVLDKNHPKILLCAGGQGGLGNSAFKSSVNQTPKKAEVGKKGEEKEFALILKLIADFGLIGLPNAGKSSLLNSLTAANVKTADYPFTTLEPNLGVYEGKVIADVPGLIEGASSGKGLGIKFLKHIEKVNLIFHCISVESNDVVKEHDTVISELANYNKKLADKKRVILLTKTDLASPEEVLKKTAVLKDFGKDILPISIYDEESLSELKKIIATT